MSSGRKPPGVGSDVPYPSIDYHTEVLPYMEFMDFLKVYQAYQEYQKTLAPKEAPPAPKQEQAAPAPVAPPAATPPDVEASLNNAMLRIAQLEQRLLNPTMENPDAKGIEDVVNRMLGES